MIETIIGDPSRHGFVPRLVRIYREKRQRQMTREYVTYRRDGTTPPARVRTVPVFRRMPRRAAFQIAWHQARNAQGLGTQE